jgi:hypothetical protein
MAVKMPVFFSDDRLPEKRGYFSQLRLHPPFVIWSKICIYQLTFIIQDDG